MSRSKVTFISVNSNQAKLHAICTKVQQCIEQEKKILIVVPNEKAAQLIDSLLWKFAEESFIPHAISQTATKECVAITTIQTENLNQAERLFNLCLHTSPIYSQFEEVYELDDGTDQQKKESAKKRFEEYRSKGAFVTIEKR